MRFMLVLLLGVSVAPRAVAQERWQQLTGAAQAYAVDLQSLEREADILSARIRTHDVGRWVIVQHVQVRCASNQLRTTHEERYDADTERPRPSSVAGAGIARDSAAWAEYVAGSEGHGLVSGLCTLARERKVLGPAEHSLRAA